MTPFDYFLRERFGMRWIVCCQRVPHTLPAGVRVEKMSGAEWEWRLCADDVAVYHSLVALMRSQRQLFAANIADRPGPLAALVNRPGSRVFDAIWALVPCTAILLVGMMCR